MDPSLVLLIAALMGAAAVLYSTVGHGGASAYLAIMALSAVPAATMRPTALALNLIVAGLASFRYLRAGEFNARLFFAVAVTAVPMAFLGGRIELPGELYRPLVGAVLLFAAWRFLFAPERSPERAVSGPSLPLAAAAGAGIGLLAGLTGTGGGIFLSPLVLLLGWETPKRTAGVSALFIVVNSLAGLAGNVSAVRALPPELPYWAAAVAAGALVGTWLGLTRLPRRRLLQALGAVLLVAGGKLVLT